MEPMMKTATITNSESELSSRLLREIDLIGDGSAVVHGGRVLSGHSLRSATEEIALCLIDAGIAPGTRLLLDLPRSVELFAACLGCIFGRISYVPAPAGITAEAREEIVQQTSSVGFITLDLVPSEEAIELPLGLTLHRRNGSSQPRLHREIYCVRTSGTTGSAKVVPIREPQLVAFLAASSDALSIGRGRRWLWMHDLSFDLSVWEVLGALWHGGCIVILDSRTKADAAVTREEIAKQSIEILTVTPSEFRFILPGGTEQVAAFRSVSDIIFCGEKLTGKMLQTVYAELRCTGARLINTYGPSEATVFCTWREVTEADLLRPSVPLGDMLREMRGEIRNPDSNGVGELVLHGPQVFDGYDNRPPLTDGHPTGDICMNADGLLMFLHRAGGFTKVNGFRVDLGEIEEHLRTHSDIDEAVALVQETLDGNAYLVACIRTERGRLTTRELRDRAVALAPYLRPARYLLLDSQTWPITAHGKTDRCKLGILANDCN